MRVRSLRVAVAVCALAVSTGVAGCGAESSPRTATPTGLPTSQPSTQQLDNLVSDRAALKDLLADPEIHMLDLEYGSDRHASVTLQGGSRTAILLTDDNWESERFLVLRGGSEFQQVYTKLLSAGDLVIVVADDDKPPLAYMFRPDGSISRLSASFKNKDRGSGTVVVDSSGNFGGVWALDAERAALHLMSRQPCDSGPGAANVAQGPDDRIHAICEADAEADDESWARLVESTDNGVSWKQGIDLPADLAPYRGLGLQLAAGPDGALAIAWSTDPATDDADMRLFVRDDQRAWRQVATGAMSKHGLPDMAYWSDGRLLMAEGKLWELPSGASTARRVQGAPRAQGLTIAGDTVVVQTGERTLAVSKDLAHWVTVEPGASVEAAR